MKPIIKVENLSKQYRLGNVGTGTIKDDLTRWWHLARGKEDPFLRIGETNDRSRKGSSDYVWALRDINFEVQPGEVLGIIGRNGAGKSTLLKILSRVTEPTTGKVAMNGRVASLLEVGTGFHPDLTGRENIYLNGAILGMSKTEINRKLDEIIDFSGVERYIDTPVKRYSSGMHVRLGFAVAAHLEPEILIVDEVLAVGDSAFQQKCMGKMKAVSEGEGRTVLFVSHNMAAVRQLCRRGIVLHDGALVADDAVELAIGQYLAATMQSVQNQQRSLLSLAKMHSGNMRLLALTINGQEDNYISLSQLNNSLQLECCFQNDGPIHFAVEARIRDEYGMSLASYSSDQHEARTVLFPPGEHRISKTIFLPEGIMQGSYLFDIYFTHPGHQFYGSIQDGILLNHEGFATAAGRTIPYSQGYGWLLLK